MCKELNDEIERGERAIKDLALHLIAMGAANMDRTIAINNCIVNIKVDIKAKI
jgi:hypothetical protein